MMRYLKRRRRSVGLNTGFRGLAGFLLAVVMLLSVAAPVGSIRVVKEDSGYAGKYIENNKDVHECAGTQILPDVGRGDTEQYRTQERFAIRGAETIGQRTAYRYRYLQQIRLLLWYLMTGFILPVLFCQRFGGGRVRQRELVSRSRMIVSYIRKADGKKNGLASSIK